MADASFIKDMISEVEQPFLAGAGGGASVRDRIAMIDDVVFGRYDYTQDLSPLLQQRIRVDADVLRSYKEQAKASLMDDFTLHLELTGTGVRKETAVDKIEALEAYTLMRLDNGGVVQDSIRYHQSMQLFWAGWLEQRPYIMPEQGQKEPDKAYTARVEHYRSSWFPWTLDVKNPATVAFMESGREITVATLRYKQPVIDLLERFGGDYKPRREDPEHALRIFNEHFGYLRGDVAQSEWTERDMYRREVEVCAFAEGSTISHYVDYTPSDASPRTVRKGGGGQYEGIGETDYDNPFGRVPLLIAEGAYNWFQPLGFRREPLMMALIRLEHGKARLKSHWASRAASPPMVYSKLPPEAIGMDVGGPVVLGLQFGGPDGKTPVATQGYGEVTEITQKVEEQMEKLFTLLNEDAQVAAPRGMLSSPGTIPATMSPNIVLAETDERNRLTAYAKQSHANVWSAALDMIRESRRRELNKHRKTGDEAQQADWGASFTTTGKEWAVKGKVLKRGDAIEVTAQDLDLEYTRTIEPVDNRESSVMARAEIAERRWAAGTILWDERLEMSGVRNVSEFNEKKAVEMMVQLDAAAEVMKARLERAETAAIMRDISVEEVLASMPETMAGQIVGAAEPGMAPRPESGGQGYTMHSPSVANTGGADAGSESVG